jgi:hypothetical protein
MKVSCEKNQDGKFTKIVIDEITPLESNAVGAVIMNGIADYDSEMMALDKDNYAEKIAIIQELKDKLLP